MPDRTPDELHQIGAIPIRWNDDGVLQVLLVTSRETRRWTIPKGWPMKGLKDHKAAAQEAREEAGVIGKARKDPIGTYLYWKRRERHFDLCRVSVYLLEISRELEAWPEQNSRDRRWFDVEQAISMVLEPELMNVLDWLVRNPKHLLTRRV
jgi:8-oxo-dGTP pyrophosphatase MutT (NUDIX family)